MMDNKAELLNTPLYDLHRELGAKMVAFAGYQMPVQYSDGVIKEHLQTRQQAGLFDVSHMGQIRICGATAAQRLEQLLPVDLQCLAEHQQCYALLTNEKGGVLDDLMICRWSAQTFFVVVNAACKAEDLAYFRAHLDADTEVEWLAQQALLALQGPAAAAVMAELSPAAARLKFMHGCATEIDGVAVYITRSGYTGEDGFEISIAAEHAESLARRLLAFKQVAPVGLAARDTLRLEAGLCLYGQELDQQISPIEAALQWAIAATRRPGGDKAGGFPGAGVILQQMVDGVTRKRVGLRTEERAPIRAGTVLETVTGDPVGTVTSGGYSPTTEVAVAMAYVDSRAATIGTQLHAMVRGTARLVTVTRLPFVPHRYYRD